MSEESQLSKKALATRLLLLLGGLAVVISATSLFVVKENETAIVLRLGRPVKTHEEPGLYARLPWPIESTVRVDRRVQYADLRLSEALTADKRNIIPHMYFAWRVEQPEKFLTAVPDPATATNRLESIITSARNAIVGKTTYESLVAAENADDRLGEIEQAILDIASPDALENLGVTVETVGIHQLNLPEANIRSVFDRMRAEREQFAARFRSEGRQAADEIRAKTDSERAVILAEAKRYVEETRGKAEAEAARIYADAHGQDPEFYEFLRKLQSLRTVVDENTTMILDTDTPPFDVLKQSDKPSIEKRTIPNPPVESSGVPSHSIPPHALAQ